MAAAVARGLRPRRLSSPPVTTREQQREETRRRLYESALAIFRRDGVVSARTEDIAKAAGVSRGSFYFHFPTKEHVLLERMAETEREVCAAIDELSESLPFAEILAAINAELTRIWEHDPQLLPDLAGAALRFTATAMNDQEATPLRAMLSERFSVAAQRGEIAVRLPAQLLGDFYLANILGGLLAWYGNPQIPLASVLAAVTEMFWNGARAPLR
jgi:AcrR family transcriptional regulator